MPFYGLLPLNTETRVVVDGMMYLKYKGELIRRPSSIISLDDKYMKLFTEEEINEMIIIKEVNRPEALRIDDSTEDCVLKLNPRAAAQAMYNYEDLLLRWGISEREGYIYWLRELNKHYRADMEEKYLNTLVEINQLSDEYKFFDSRTMHKAYQKEMSKLTNAIGPLPGSSKH